MLLAFTLSMPNVASWDGKWSGEGRPYVKVHTINGPKAIDLTCKGSFYYDFGDGWGASVGVRRVDSATAKKLRKQSKGFCGYEWMIREIIDYGRIKTLAERTKAGGAG